MEIMFDIESTPPPTPLSFANPPASPPVMDFQQPSLSIGNYPNSSGLKNMTGEIYEFKMIFRED